MPDHGTANTPKTVEAARKDLRFLLVTVQRECEAASRRIDEAISSMDQRIASAAGPERALDAIAQITLEALDPLDALWRHRALNPPIATPNINPSERTTQ